MRKIWSDDAWEDYLYWQSQDKKTLKKINRLLQDIDRFFRKDGETGLTLQMFSFCLK